MARKTYIPTAIRILRTFCVYFARWQPALRKNLPPEAFVALEAVVVACDVFLALVEPLDSPD